MAVRQFNWVTSYRIKVHGLTFLVNIERIKNGINGNPRWSARITMVNSQPEGFEELHGYYSTAVYHFDGHYYTPYEEAEWIAYIHYNKHYK